MTRKVDEHWQRGDAVDYISQQIPPFEIPRYSGEYYEALAPDTLDLQERAALAVNVLTGNADPGADYEMHFAVHFDTNPPMMQHDYHDHCQNKFMEALPLMRIISGLDQDMEVDRRWMEVSLLQQGPDGLLYTPVGGRPWALIGASGWNVTPVGDQFIDPFWGGRMLTSLSLYFRRSGEPIWKQAAERLVDGLAELALDRGRYALFAPSACYAEKGNTDEEYGRSNPLMGASVAFVALGLVHAYRELGYEPAIQLAGKLIRYYVDELRYFGDDGSFTPGIIQWPGAAHFHMHTYALLAMLEYSRAVDDADLLELVRRGYEYGRDNGDALLGYFPEILGSEQLEHSELCEVADMIALGLKLTTAGVGDYLDDVDRWVRNMFAEGQITPEKAHWLERFSANRPTSALNPMYQTTDRVVERNVAFPNNIHELLHHSRREGRWVNLNCHPLPPSG